MLYKYQPSDIDAVKRQFKEDSLYSLIVQVCGPYTQQTKPFNLFAEQVFAEAVMAIDDIKEQQGDADVRGMWVNLINDYTAVGADTEESQLEKVTTIVLGTIGCLLYSSPYALHQRMGKQVYLQLAEHGMSELGTELARRYEAHGPRIQEWMKEYVDSERFLSELLPSGGQPDAHSSAVAGGSGTIPADCLKKAQAVLTSSYRVGQRTIVSSSRMRDVANGLRLDGPGLARFFLVSKSVGCIKLNATSSEFVDALVGLGCLTYGDEGQLSRLSEAMRHKLNGQQSKGIAPLDADYKRWAKRDQTLGKQIYEALTK